MPNSCARDTFICITIIIEVDIKTGFQLIIIHIQYKYSVTLLRQVNGKQSPPAFFSKSLPWKHYISFRQIIGFRNFTGSLGHTL